MACPRVIQSSRMDIDFCARLLSTGPFTFQSLVQFPQGGPVPLVFDQGERFCVGEPPDFGVFTRKHDVGMLCSHAKAILRDDVDVLAPKGMLPKFGDRNGFDGIQLDELGGCGDAGFLVGFSLGGFEWAFRVFAAPRNPLPVAGIRSFQQGELELSIEFSVIGVNENLERCSRHGSDFAPEVVDWVF